MLPIGWGFRRNPDGSIGIFAPPAKPGESPRTSDVVYASTNRDLHELLSKFIDHVDAQPEPELPPWLLGIHDATVIANTYRVRVGVVQAIAKATHTALQRSIRADQSSREMFVARLNMTKENGTNSLTVAQVLCLLNDCDMLASRELVV